jgi:hypothetical protein
VNAFITYASTISNFIFPTTVCFIYRLTRRPGSVYVGFLVNRVVLGLFFSSSSGFPCQRHSTVAVHTRVLSGG